MKSAHFNSIAIIQSIPSCEIKTGSRLREDLEILNVAYDRGIKIELSEVCTKSEFVDELQQLKKNVDSNGSIPVIHIEAHGSSDQKGLVLSSGDFVSWTELKPLLISLNVATKNNLLVFLAACSGAHLTEVVDLTDRAPCWGLAGPIKAVSSDDLAKSFLEFYRELLATGCGGNAVKALNSATGDKETKYMFTNTEAFFKKTYKYYIRNGCSEQELYERARRMRKITKKNGISKVPSVGQMKRKLKGTQEEYFKKFKNHFFMIDLFPENEYRFTVLYKDFVDY